MPYPRASVSKLKTTRSKRKSHTVSRSIVSKTRSTRSKITRNPTSQSRRREVLTAEEMALDDEENEFGANDLINLQTKTQLHPLYIAGNNQDQDEEIDDKDDDTDTEIDTESIMARLARQFSPEQEGSGEVPDATLTNPRLPLRSSILQTADDAETVLPTGTYTQRPERSSNVRPEDDAETVLPTVDNYKQLVDEWPPARIAVQDRLQKKKRAAVPPKILTEARAIQNLYKQHKSLLAIMGNFSTFTLNKALGELGGRRRPSGYQIWLKFGKEIEKHQKRMPRKWGQKGVLASRNKILGKIWSGLPYEHKEVFSPPVFHALSGLHYLQHGKKLEPDEDEKTDAIEFEPGEREMLQALYDQLVWKEKFAKEYSKATKGVASGPSLPDYNRQSLKSIERLQNQIEDESNNMGFDYYLLACSKHSSTEVSSSSRGWCREYTSIEEMEKYVNKKSNFATMFAARAQGLSVGEIVAETIGGNGITKEKARKTDPGDKVKSDLALALRSRMKALLGFEVGFPRGPDPESILLDKYNIKIIQMHACKLPHETLKLGFNAMNSRRSLWLDDVKANLFKLEKFDTGHEQNDDDNRMDLDEEVTNTQDLAIDDEVDEDEEWTGLGDME
ncbi:uncharacterized protein MELLADRAFT_95022 [Melampsora larici-populina 98AG31]|uniref:Uncharacterized protein n=1 Tax=Melampsora larici-populina (strain 98AG31 / pathotype 3-4-7) TaxID=747676 RepID=F4S8U6_MELLP|nr:uncharacterized protein MELLADRAFT_95022 [Melampsora larici-populina 98AG31]EGF98959.1 hypothetical protein MELLADRAFT_95022 [Melampsora larici-populina 98AG31]